VSIDEVLRLPDDVLRIELVDFDFDMITKAFSVFGISLSDLDVISAAVFDHGAAPPGYSDRQFRFDYIKDRIDEKPSLSSFAFLDDDIPSIMTRMGAVASSVKGIGLPLVVMDTAPAAVLGAMQDPLVGIEDEILITNVGNFHTIGFHMVKEEIKGVFEHHTGMLDAPKLDDLLNRLGKGSLTHDEVFEDHGHGALTCQNLEPEIGRAEFRVAVTGPRRTMMRRSMLKPYYATPHGDMMMAGCFGLVEAVGEIMPEYQEEINGALGQGREKPPWELT
jgi:uncharacterized protein (DUF1786 family)